ncbi:hypothetical protein SapgrDRAFT_0890 [Saprospira grandis DSM 2844]|uniref:Uncharacterized protein n=1 Tax=Saprospira grandis DSM 2844 TaxID=694433 RepID=J0P5D3_9BACT|nr:hypothetical protein [Saprospira grandis]EJF52622.1 hypothetical protein SapgrDRAFT_0890 [Saprospira grandis DSM 2844]
MPNNQILTLEETCRLIQAGELLLIAASQELLDQLPAGQWLGGTIPYFMSEAGAEKDLDHLFVSNLSNLALKAEIKSYSAQEFEQLLADRPKNGFSYIAMPVFSEVHKAYAIEIGQYESLYDSPILGWVTGKDLEAKDEQFPAVYHGPTASCLSNKAVLMHIELPESQYAEIEIYNPYEQGQGDRIEFLENDFSAAEVLINGEKQNFAHYCRSNNIKGQLPLLANYSGALVNIDIERIEENRVYFYGPVSTDQIYYWAKEIRYSPNAFLDKMPHENAQTAFNCISIYFNFQLNGVKLANYGGPFTFGEIAYLLLNQTLVLLYIQDK